MLCWATKKIIEPAVKTLIEGHADITFHDNAGMSPLFYAAEEGDDTVVRLIKAKAPLNIVSESMVSQRSACACETGSVSARRRCLRRARMWMDRDGIVGACEWG